MSERMTFRVSAGAHRRRRCPVHVIVPEIGPRPTLWRPGRNRPIPCQCTPDPEGVEIAWIVDSLSAGDAVDYEMIAGLRQRPYQRRVVFDSQATGWRVQVRRRRCADILIPQTGAPHAELFGLNGRIVRIAFTHSAPDLVGPRYHGVRAGDVETAAGAVFGQIAATYAVVDASDRPAWSERHRLRIYDGPPEAVAIDWRVEWIATTGPVRLGAPPGRLPILEGTLPSGREFRFDAGAGWNATEIADRPAPFLSAAASDLCLAILARSSNFGFPPCFQIGAPRFETIPTLRDDHASQPSRLLLGDSIAVEYRIWLYDPAIARDPFRFSRDRFLDFDVPPLVERRPEVTGESKSPRIVE